jgi:hypothetical protein
MENVTRFKRKKADRLYNPTSSSVQEALERDRNNYNIDDRKEVGVTYSTASEAFKDADYATSLWRCESDWEIATRYFTDGIIGVLFAVGSVSIFIYGLSVYLRK